MADVPDFKTDDMKLIEALLQSALAETAWTVATRVGVDVKYAEDALARMADQRSGLNDYPILRREDLGRDVYEAVEDSAREGDG